jgi:maltose O-acetyltransferase
MSGGFGGPGPRSRSSQRWLSPPGLCTLATVSAIRDAVGRVGRRAANRVRGESSIARLVSHGLKIGEAPHIARPIYVDGLHPWLISIGDYVTLGPYVAIITHDTSLAHHTGVTRLGRVDIGDRVYVGVGAIILPGTVIGDDSVVGAGAVVHGEVPAGSLVLGNPGKASPIKPVAAWYRASAARAPTWPREGSSAESGITEERKHEQREALADCAAGYVPATAAPGSPYALKKRETKP